MVWEEDVDAAEAGLPGCDGSGAYGSAKGARDAYAGGGVCGDAEGLIVAGAC
jgi:hypothetical protein